MPTKLHHVGLDVHAETITVAVAEADGSVRELGTIRNRAYRHRANMASGLLRARQAGQPAPIIAIATKAQHRLCPRYRKLTERGKPPLAVATVIARELLGFIWALGHAVEPLPVGLGATMST